MPPTSCLARMSGEAPSAKSTQEQEGIDPGAKLDRSNSGERVETLLVAQAKARLSFAVGDFQFPTLPGPKQEGLGRQGQRPLTIVLEDIDQIKAGFAPTSTAVALPGLPAHDEEKQGIVRRTTTDKGAFDAV